MQIEGISLTEAHVGREVTYLPPYAKGDLNHKDCVSGTIKRWNDTYVFVTYSGAVNGTQGTRPQDLVWS